MNRDLLVEIGTEELPPKALQRLSDAFTRSVADGLEESGLQIGIVQPFATPRRLAVLVKDVPEAQPDRDIERKGPSLKAAYDADGKPTRAVEGFARSCGVSVEDLEQQETDKGTWLVFRAKEKGRPVEELVPAIVDQSLARLPIPKRMRWGDSSAEFVRPVHWVVMMHGKKVINGDVLGVSSGNKTRGHRFHANREIVLSSAGEYAEKLASEGFVIADSEQRKQSIRGQVIQAAETLAGNAVINDDLLAEVTALNEWPIAVAGEFEKEYLSVPAEALIKTMQDNQKYFPVVDNNNDLKNCFITISNIDSKAPEKVKVGNERVIRPRLADAKFFWEQDQKQPLELFGKQLNKVVFQEKLGSIGDKTKRVMALAERIADRLGANTKYARRAAELSKCDLMTDMVGEFATLQGIMGRRYAQVAGEHEEVAAALEEQYMPRGASDTTAATTTGQILAISDKLDTLVGIFAIGQKPTGEKDPYALRRASLGILRTIIERGLDLDLQHLINAAAELYVNKVDASSATEEVFEFMLERLRAYYLDRGVLVDVFDAVSALKPTRPLDFDRRIRAVSTFRALPEAESLSAANKRVGNILKKADAVDATVVNAGLFELQEEETLYNELEALKSKTEPMFESGDYESALRDLSALRGPIDEFFDNVMVMTDNMVVRNNRIALLDKMSKLFMRAADLSRLHQA
ncbi:MAG: glycine--tRNA ligase subunit beta [Gammaproteobacteria bacterium]|nr:glycine--tRNA ligase subunit beta [Gammaproteobacteria bacterium]NNL06714.1 glycine--tRNA ligase subunit beta [Gammaproteobacteria bacterium]